MNDGTDTDATASDAESHDVEQAVATRLRDHFIAVGRVAPDLSVAQIMERDGFRDRFSSFVPRMPESVRRRLLVSGCSVGTEMLVARDYGFREVVGTEVNALYVEIARQRLGGVPDLDVVLYDGSHLPFDDESFSSVVSGHVIEHTPSPWRYFREHFRVLEPGGMMFIEFPDRYHPIELHTGLPSLERWPLPIRELLLLRRESERSKLSPEQREWYREIRTQLRPVGEWQVRAYLAIADRFRGQVVDVTRPAPGFVRVLVRKQVQPRFALHDTARHEQRDGSSASSHVTPCVQPGIHPRLSVAALAEFTMEPLEDKDPRPVMAKGCRVLEDLGATYWVAAGTVLGLVRDGGFIRHDTDIDVEMRLTWGDRDAGRSLADGLVAGFRDAGFIPIREMNVDGHDQPMQLAFVEPTSNIIFDIYFFYEGIESGLLVNYNDHGVLAQPIRYFEALESRVIGGYPYPFPAPAEEYLLMRYGPDWRVPRQCKSDWPDYTANLRSNETFASGGSLEP